MATARYGPGYGAYHLTGTGNIWVTDFEAASWAPEGNNAGETRYSHMFVDGRRMIITMIQDTEMPTLGVLSGSGGHIERSGCI